MVSEVVDVWVFGVMFFEMLSGVCFFVGDMMIDIFVEVFCGEFDWSMFL